MQLMSRHVLHGEGLRISFSVLVVVGGALILAGCASRREIRAFDELRAEERRVYTAPELPVLDESSGLGDYLVYAALNNAGLEAAFNRWKAELEKVPQARALPDPMFSYTHFIRTIETRTGALTNWFRLSQKFPWFSKLLLRRDVALEAAKAAQRRYEDTRLKLFYTVKDAYYEYYYWGRAVQVLRENVQLVGYLESVAREAFKTGGATHADVIRAQVELGELEDRLRSLRDLRQPIVARLNAALHRFTSAPLPTPKAILEEKVSVNDEELFELLKHNSPELQALKAEAAREKTSIDLAKKDYFPDITIQGEVIDVGEAERPRPSDSGQDPVAVTVMVNVPIWFSKYRAGVREAKARYAAALNKQNHRENDLLAELQMALYNFRDAGRKISLFRDTLLPKARQSLKVSQQAFEAGKADFLDLIDAERKLLEFELFYERALADRAQRLAEIEKIVGRQIDRIEVPAEEDQPEPNRGER